MVDFTDAEWKRFIYGLRRDFNIKDPDLGDSLILGWSRYREKITRREDEMSSKRYRRRAAYIAAHLSKATKKLREIEGWQRLATALNDGSANIISTSDFLDSTERLAKFLRATGVARYTKGPAPKSTALYDWVSELGDYWLEHRPPNKRLTQGFTYIKGKGLQPAKNKGFAHFTYSIVKQCEPSELPSLKQVVERYVTAWRRSRNFLY